jgi:glycosyltransferase involved in cell wall biosynthesis
MHFRIITPSFNQLDYLRRCIASVRDQVSGGALNVKDVEKSLNACPASTCNDFDGLNVKAPFSVHHHIQDGGSTDGTVEFLKKFRFEVGSWKFAEGRSSYSFSFASERDNGMYDALNRGIDSSLQLGACSLESDEKKECFSDEQDVEKPSSNFKLPTSNCDDSIVAWLNCDEQYLPGTLEVVSSYFEQHPDVDVLFGDYLVVDEAGNLLSFRKGCRPRLWYIQASHLNNLSCTMFFRSRVFLEMGGFNANYKAVADEEFVVRSLKAGFKARYIRRYLAAFTYTGRNLGGGEAGQKEFAVLKSKMPLMLKWLRLPLNGIRWLEKFLSGTYFQRFPLSYALYTDEDDERKKFSSERVGWKWPRGDGGT